MVKKSAKKSQKKSSRKSSKKAQKKSTRKSAKKVSKKKAVPKKEESNVMGLIVGALIILVILIAAIAYLANQEEPAFNEETVLVTVNGQELTRQDVQFQYNLLPSSYKAQLTEKQVIEQIISEELIVQAAIDQGVEVSEEDVNSRVQEILTENQITIQELETNLALMNVTIDDFENLIMRQLYIDRYSGEMLETQEPTDEELQSLYDLQQEQFTTPQQVTVRHILISSQRDEAAQLARDLVDRVRAGEDFCLLVENYTDDSGSRDTCGEYTFPREFMVPEFEEASFDMDPGEVRLVQTQFGYHVIEKIEDVPSQVQEFEEVRGQLTAQVESAQYIQAYETLTSQLRADADIVYTQEYEEMYGEPPTQEALEPKEQVVPNQEPTEPTVPQQEPEDSVDMASLLSCISEESTLYGTSWDSNTKKAIEMFAEKEIELDYILCDNRESLCEQEGIQGYPTWVIQGEVYLGRMSLDELARAAGCEE